MIDYDIAQGSNVTSLRRDVGRLLNAGFEPHGNLVITVIPNTGHTFYSQAMIKQIVEPVEGLLSNSTHET